MIATGPISTNEPTLLNPSPEPHAIVSSIVPASTTLGDHEALAVRAPVVPTRERASRLT